MDKAASLLEVSADNPVPGRMGSKPAFAVFQQFLDLILADVIVLLLVEDRDKNIEMIQKLRQRDLSTDCQIDVRAVSPFGEFSSRTDAFTSTL